MQYDSKIVAHSISHLHNDIITWEITIPKWLIGEVNTHKVEIERNSASSRAVPTEIILDMVETNPCLPIWMYNQRGMSALEPLNSIDEEYANEIWLETRDFVMKQVQRLQQLPSGRSVAKGTANRLLEFVMWTKVVVTMTGGGKIGINNFFGLRDNDAAQPEFREIAHMMHTQYHNSTPIERTWHLPYVSESPEYLCGIIGTTFDDEVYKKLAVISSARCGRVTHYRQGQEYSLEEDMKRGMSFAEQGHFSPLRHASKAGQNEWYGNMYGWQQISKLIMPDGRDYIRSCCSYEHSS